MTARHLALVTPETLRAELEAESFIDSHDPHDGFSPPPAPPRSARSHANTYQRTTCPKCGNAGRYQVDGICRACGWPVSQTVPTDFPTSL